LARTLQGADKEKRFCHSERSEESLFDLAARKEREIPRSARNDKKMGHIFRNLFKQQVAPAVSLKPAANRETRGLLIA